MQRFRDVTHLGLDQSLLFIFIVDFAFVTVRIGKHVTIIMDSRAGIGESNRLIPLVADYSGLRVDSLTEERKWSPLNNGPYDSSERYEYRGTESTCNEKRAKHTQNEEGVAQGPKHRKADLEFASNPFERSAFPLK